MKLINKKQTGFTLIELIIVIVILGILAVTAAPKFLDLQGDANKATLDGIKGSMESAKSVVYGKALIAGVQNNVDYTLTNVEGSNSVIIDKGYPDEDWATTWTHLLDINAVISTADASNADFVVYKGDSSVAGAVVLQITPKSTLTLTAGIPPVALPTACFASYSNLNGVTAISVTGC